jgi:uncharacterized SAM-binding protein YcdF (DUF218 family)
MRGPTSVNTRRGITVLGLLLLIIALIIAGFFLVRYLRTRQAVTQSLPLVRPVSVTPSLFHSFTSSLFHSFTSS